MCADMHVHVCVCVRASIYRMCDALTICAKASVHMYSHACVVARICVCVCVCVFLKACQCTRQAVISLIA